MSAAVSYCPTNVRKGAKLLKIDMADPFVLSWSDLILPGDDNPQLVDEERNYIHTRRGRVVFARDPSSQILQLILVNDSFATDGNGKLYKHPHNAQIQDGSDALSFPTKPVVIGEMVHCYEVTGATHDDPLRYYDITLFRCTSGGKIDDAAHILYSQILVQKQNMPERFMQAFQKHGEISATCPACRSETPMICTIRIAEFSVHAPFDATNYFETCHLVAQNCPFLICRHVNRHTSGTIAEYQQYRLWKTCHQFTGELRQDCADCGAEKTSKTAFIGCHCELYPIVT